MSERVECVTMWRTEDQKLHPSEDAAERWADHLEAVEAGNALLSSGASVAAAARRAGIPVPDGSVLERITTHTPLIVSHYQCRDQPGYKVVHINSDDTLHVFGHAGSWSGAYGNHEGWRDVERYAAHTLAAAARITERGEAT